MRRALLLLSCVALVGATDPRAPRAQLNIVGSHTHLNYVDIECSVDRDAYVLVVGVDLDRRVHVLFPAGPDADALITREHSVGLPRFRGGAGNRGDGQFPASGVHDPRVLTEERANNGVLLVVASSQPLHLDGLLDGSGEWNPAKLGPAIFNGSAASAAMALGKLITAPRQPYSVDSRVDLFR